MSPIRLGIICGLGFGTLDVLMMLPLDFPDKPTALSAAFASRFAIGFLIPHCKMAIPQYCVGMIIGLLISVPDAIITKAFGPILVSGLLGGLIIGWVTKRFSSKA